MLTTRQTTRRSFLAKAGIGLASFIAAPAIVQITNLMPLRGVRLPLERPWELQELDLGYVVTRHTIERMRQYGFYENLIREPGLIIQTNPVLDAINVYGKASIIQRVWRKTFDGARFDDWD